MRRSDLGLHASSLKRQKTALSDDVIADHLLGSLDSSDTS